MSTSKTIAQYKDFTQLQEYATAQELTIIQLSKKVQKLEDERNHFKKLLESSGTLISTDKKQLINEDDSENICNLEISKLRDNSIQRELTLEECRKLETYVKILTQLESRKKKPTEKEAEKLDTTALWALVENEDGKK